MVDLLNEIANNCSDLNGDDFLLAPSKVPQSSVEGYEIHMTGRFTEASKKYLNDLAIKRGLSIIQHPNSVMLFESKPELNSKTH